MKTTSEVTDLHTLILRIAKGDEASLEIFYDEINKLLSGYLASTYAELRRDDINSIIEYTFVQVWQKANTYRGAYTNNSAKHWIFTIARNRAKQELKIIAKVRNSLDTDISRSDDNENNMPALEYKLFASDNTEKEALTRIMVGKIMEIIRTFPKREQRIFTMRFMEGYKLQVIAKRHSLSIPRITQILNRLLKMIFYDLQ